jgi:hypothetical protein
MSVFYRTVIDCGLWSKVFLDSDILQCCCLFLQDLLETCHMSSTIPLPPREQLYNRYCSNKHTPVRVREREREREKFY